MPDLVQGFGFEVHGSGFEVGVQTWILPDAAHVEVELVGPCAVLPEPELHH